MRNLIDRWRRGPELRAAQGQAADVETALSATRLLLDSEKQRTALLERALQDRDFRLHLLGDLVRTLKARCARCGNLVWNWAAQVVEGPDGNAVLQPTCEGCSRAVKREEERAAKKAEAATETAAADPAA